MGATTQQYAMDRRRMMADAKANLLDAMEKSTRENGEMTAMEWLEVLSGMADFLRRDALRDEWTDGAPTTEGKVVT